MEAILNERFLDWAAGMGIRFDPRYPDARCLAMMPPRQFARFWELPGDPAAWPHFAASLLEGLDSWSAGYLWPRSGRWPAAEDSSSINEDVLDVVLRGAGIADGWCGGIKFNLDESDKVIAVLFAYLAFGWCVDDDLFFVPNHGWQVFQTDHHDVIHVECAAEARVLQLVAHMENEGYPLPTAPPDDTFKWPSWMPQSGAEK
jgi:hypothetical protein